MSHYTSRIPRTRNEFNSYINTSATYLAVVPQTPPLTPNWQRLGLTQEAFDQWTAMKDAWNQLWAKYTDRSQKTATVNEEITLFMESFRLFAQPLLNIMASSPNATPQDANTLNFKIGRSEPTHPHTPIAEPCIISSQSVGGGRVRFSCRADVESRRASLPHDADCVEYSFKVGGAAPASPLDGTQQFTVTRASSMRDFGVQNVGQVLYLYARWSSTRHQDLAGVWSPLTTVNL